MRALPLALAVALATHAALGAGLDSGLAPVFGPSGLQSNVKVWHGVATTAADGSWSASIASAGCTGTPTVSADALSSGSTIALSATAVVVARTSSTVSGFVNLPATIAVGGLSAARAGAGLTVDLIAFCQ